MPGRELGGWREPKGQSGLDGSLEFKGKALDSGGLREHLYHSLYSRLAGAPVLGGMGCESGGMLGEANVGRSRKGPGKK